MNPVLSGLLEFARPHRGRLVAALVAMLLYAAASAGVAALIQPIFDQVLPKRENLFAVSAALLSIYFVKGIGAYLSGYLMTDVGQRVVRDVRNVLFRHILGQSAAFFSAADDRPADVAHHQRRRPGAAVGL